MFADCDRNLKKCALKRLVTEVRRNRDDDREKLSRESWDTMLAFAVTSGDEFFDYDGPATTF